MERKNAIVTGAASGIGRAVALRFAREGYNVAVNDIQREALDSLQHELAPGNHLLLPGGYHDRNTVDAFDEQIRTTWGRVDVLVNCAGLSRKTDFFEMEIDQWRVIFDTMVNGCLRMTLLAARHMFSGGAIIHITSIHGVRAERFSSSYSMAKAAINQFCRSMALELADRNILVNAIAPGFVRTAMSSASGENELETQWFADNYVTGHHLPLRRAATPEEIGGVALFLAGPDARYITGQVITVDGGLSITF